MSVLALVVGSTIPRGSQCGSCGGVGKVRAPQTIEVDIPPGTSHVDKLFMLLCRYLLVRRRGRNDYPRSESGRCSSNWKGGRPVTCLCGVSVAPSKQFTRQGANLFHEVKVPFHTALLGGRVRVPTIDGDVDVRLPGGTQQGEEMVLKGRGVPEVRNGLSGDLYVTFSVVLPR